MTWADVKEYNPCSTKNSSFDSCFKSCQHVFSPYGRFRPFSAGADVSGLFRLFCHCRQFCFHLYAPNTFAFLQCLCSMPVTALHRYYDRSDSCPAALRSVFRHEHRPFPDRSLCLTHIISWHSATNHPMTHHSRFNTIPLNSVTMASSDLWTSSFPRRLVVSSGRIVFDVCGLPVLFPLLSTPHRCDAVTFRYGPELVCPERTFTSL